MQPFMTREGDSKGRRPWTYRTVLLPPPQHILEIQIRLQLIRYTLPYPTPTPLLLVVIQLVPIYVRKLVAIAMTLVLNLIKRPWSRHADVNSNVDVATLVRIPERGHQVSHNLVVDTYGMGVHEDPDFGDFAGYLASAGVLGAEGWEVFW